MKRFLDVFAVLVVPGLCLLVAATFLKEQPRQNTSQTVVASSGAVICPLTGQPLGADEICSLVTQPIPSNLTGRSRKNEPAGESPSNAGPPRGMTKLTPEEIQARVYAVDPTNRFAYPGRPYVIGAYEWVLDNSVLDESGRERRVRRSTGRNHRSTGRLSDRFSDIPLKNEDGETVRFYSDLVKDQVVVVTFFYTRCTGICAPTNENIVELRKLLARSIGPEVRFISISLDSDFDKPEVLKAFAAHYKGQDADSEVPLPRWDFVCGNWDEVNILRKEMGVYDLDPVIDSDRSQHAGIMTFGNDRTDRWSAIASLLPASAIQSSVLKFAGSQYKDPRFDVRSIVSTDRWEIRGPMTGLRAWNHGLSVLGAEEQIPDSLEIEGTTGIRGEMLKDLVDSTVHQGLRVLMPYPGQTAVMVSASGGYDDRNVRVADHLRVDPATHQLAGVLSATDDGGLMIAGIPLIENPDLRFPMLITDLSGQELSMQRMPQCLGKRASARGYFLDGSFFAVHLQLDDLVLRDHQPEGPSLQIQLAASDRLSGLLRIIGTTKSGASIDGSEIEIVDGTDGHSVGRATVKASPSGFGQFSVQTCELNRVPSFVILKWNNGSEMFVSERQVVQPSMLNEIPEAELGFVQGPLQSLAADLATLSVGALQLQTTAQSLFFPESAREMLAATHQTSPKARSLLPADMNSGIPVRVSFRDLQKTEVGSPVKMPVEARLIRLLPEECRLAGKVETVDENKKTAQIAGVTVQLEGDVRFPLVFETVSGYPTSVESLKSLKSLEGQTVIVHGLSHVTQQRAETGSMTTECIMIAVRVQLPDEVIQPEVASAARAE